MPKARSHISRSPEDDDELLRRARDGDTQARGELVSRYQEAILRFCQTYLGGLHDAEDAVQDVMACVATGDKLPDQRFRPWLYRVARNRCLAALRTRRNGRVGTGSVAGDSRWASPRTGPRTAVLRNEWYERLRRLRVWPSSVVGTTMLAQTAVPEGRDRVPCSRAGGRVGVAQIRCVGMSTATTLQRRKSMATPSPFNLWTSLATWPWHPEPCRKGWPHPGLLDAQRVLDAAVGDGHIRTMRVGRALAALYAAWGKPAEAAAWWARCHGVTVWAAEETAGLESP